MTPDGVRSGLWPRREELLGLRVGAVVVTHMFSVTWFDREITRAGGHLRELPVFQGEFVLGVIDGGASGRLVVVVSVLVSMIGGSN